MRRFLLGSLLGCMALLTVTETANAQIYGYGRGGRWGGTAYYVETPYFSYGQGYYNRYGGWYGDRYNTWYGRNYGRGYYDRDYYLTVGTPWYATRSYYTGPTYYPTYGVEYSRSMYSPSAESDKANIQIMVPTSAAKVWFGDHQTEQTGLQRSFISPALEGGKNYTYTIRASWMDKGREMFATKEVEVTPGRTSWVSFNPGDGSDTSRIPIPPAEKMKDSDQPKKDPEPKERLKELPPQ